MTPWPASSPWVWPPKGSPWVWPPSVPSAADPSMPPLPASTVEWWHSEKGISLVGGQVQGWTGQKRGVVLAPNTAGFRPDYGADGAFFHGRNVVKTVPGGTVRALSSNVVPPLAAAGTKPQVYALFRQKVFTADVRVISLHNFAVSSVTLLTWFSTTGFWGTWWFPHPNVQTPPLTTSAVTHRLTTYIDAAGSIFSLVDANSNNAGAGLSSPGNFDAIHVGSDRNLNAADASFAFVLVCSSQITPAELAALDAWALSYWGVP